MPQPDTKQRPLEVVSAHRQYCGLDAHGELETASERDRHCTKPIARVIHKLEIVAVLFDDTRRSAHADDQAGPLVSGHSAGIPCRVSPLQSDDRTSQGGVSYNSTVTLSPVLIVPGTSTVPTIPLVSFAAFENAADDNGSPERVV